MLKRILLLSLLLPIFSISIFSVSQKTNVLVLPFQNKASVIHDKLADYIASYIILLFKDHAGYQPVPLFRLKSRISQAGYTGTDLANQDTIKSLAAEFQARFIIHGYFTQEGNSILVSYKLYSYAGKSLKLSEATVSIKMSGSDPLTLNESFDKLMGIMKEMDAVISDSGTIEVRADHECVLIVDSEERGKTPLRYRISAGEHEIKLVYGNPHPQEVLLSQKTVMKSGGTIKHDIRVFTPISINAEEKCSVYINGEERGATPFSARLFSGREYLVEVAYFYGGNKKISVFKEIVSTNKEPAPMFFSAKGSIRIDCQPPFFGGLADDAPLPLPLSICDLAPGDYRIKVMLKDPSAERSWIFLDRTCTVFPFTGETLIDGSQIERAMNPLYPLVPGAGQFANHEPEKGWIVIGLLASALAFTGYSIYGYYSHSGEFDRLSAEFVSTGNSGLIPGLNNEKRLVDLHSAFILSGATASALVYLYSLVDGYATMNYIHRVIKDAR